MTKVTSWTSLLASFATLASVNVAYAEDNFTFDRDNSNSSNVALANVKADSV